jgi:GNAT superfamily N-acetyltransferase
VATGSAVAYDDSYAFCGLYIVAREERGKGYGAALTQARLAYCGERIVGVDTVPEEADIYRRVGYRQAHENYRFQCIARPLQMPDVHVRPLEAEDFPAVLAYDRQCFPAARDVFIRTWLTQANGQALVYMQDGALKGFGMRRKCRVGHKVGPLFADDAAIADALLSALQDDVVDQLIILDVPGNNGSAVRLAQRNRMEKVSLSLRMYRRGTPDVAHHKIFGITAAELG